MKENFIVGEKYYVSFKGNQLNLSSWAGGTLIRITTSSSLRYEYGTSGWLSLTTAQISAYDFVEIEFVSGSQTFNINLGKLPNTFYTLVSGINLSTKISIVGALFSTTHENDYLKPFAIEHPVEIHMMRFNGEKNLVDKENMLTTDFVLYGALREETDVLNPSILIEWSQETGVFDVGIFNENYAYIPDFQRYYFITNITYVRKNIVRVSMHVDVLYTYKLEIGQQENVFVVRSQTQFDQAIDDDIGDTVDDRVNFNDHYSVTYSKKTDTTSNPLTNVSFSVGTTTFRYVACVVNDKTALTPVNITAPESHLPLINGSAFKNPLTFDYVFNAVTLGQFLDGIKDSSSRQSKVVSLIALPFDVTAVESNDALPNEAIRVGSEDVTNIIISGLYAIKSDVSKYLVVADFTASELYTASELDWANYEPYCYHELYLPYYGWVQINGKDIVGKRILVYYSVNYQTGDAQVYVYSYSSAKIIFTATCQLGIKIPISVSNAEENSVQRLQNGTNLALGVIGGAVATGIGIASANPVAIAGGVMSVTKSIAGAITGEQAIFDRVNGQVSSGNSGLYMPQAVQYKVSYKKMHEQSNVLNTEFFAINGYKVNQYANVYDLTGYTEIGNMHYYVVDQDYILKPEIDEIESLAREGIYL